MSGDGSFGTMIGAPIDDRALADYGRDDIGNAQRFIVRCGDRVRETQRYGRLWFEGNRWVIDDGDVRIARALQETARGVRLEAKALQEDLKANPKDEFLADAVDKHWKWAVASANGQRLNAMKAQALPHLQHDFEAWNARSDLFNLPSGTLDLTSLEPRLREHRREDYITRIGNAAYEPAAPAALWRAFVEKVLPDPEIRAFVQRAVGSCLMDSVSDQVIIVFHGAGANGKSTFLDVICDIFGDYAMSVSVTSFLATDRTNGSSPQPDLVRLAYRPRLVRTSEPPPGGRLAEGVIKEVTGGEPMVARDLQEKPIEFRPNFKIFFSCNTRPSIRGGDDGIWRRIRLVPWTVQIPPEERDGGLKEKLLAERDGIFAWIVEGWQQWRERGGLDAPAAVLEASEEYRTESDTVGRFLSEWCEKGEGLEEPATLLHDAYEVWAKLEGIDPIGGNIFGRRLTDRGYGKRKSNGIIHRVGISLTKEAREEARFREAERMTKAKKASHD